MIYIELIFNLSLLVAISVVSGFIEKRWAQRSRSGVLMQGCLFGTAAIIGMLNPLDFGPGLIFDGRSVVLSLCALFYGPWAAAASGILAIGCRVIIGGAGTLMGVLVVLSSVGIGLAAHVRWRPASDPPSAKQLYLFGLAVHAAMLAMTVTLPDGHIWAVFKGIALPVILLYPLATILAGKILSDQAARLQFMADLTETQQNLDTTLRSIGDAVISTDLDGRILLMNPVAERLTGWPLIEAREKPLNEVFHIVNAHTRRPAENPVDKVLARGTIVGLANHTALIARDGRDYQIADSAAPISAADGRVTGVVMVFRDVTDAYAAQEALRASETLFRKMFEDHAAAMLIIDPESHRIVDANHAAAGFYGWSREELKQMTIGEINTLAPEQMQKNMELAGARQQISFQFQHRMADGTLRDVEVYSSRISVKGQDLLHSIVHDVTQRKQTESALIESETRYRNLIMHSPDAVYVEVDDRIVLVNHACRRLIGAGTEDDLIGKSPYDLFHVRDHERIRARKRHIRDHKEAVPIEERKAVRLDGTEVDVEVVAAPFVFEGASAIHVILRDITLRKEDEAVRERLLAAIEQSAEMVVITDLSGVILYVNPAFERITGYGKDEAVGATPRLLKSGEHDEAYYLSLWQTITNGQIWRGQFVNRRKTGELYTEEATISPVRDASDRIVNFVAVKRDISEALQMEQRLMQAQKMEAIGALAGGIAHDFNNLLFPILGMSEMLLEDLAEGSEDRENVMQIYNAAMRAGDLVRQILSFSRQTDNAPIPLRIQTVLKEVVKLMRATLPANIPIRQNISNDCGRVLIDPTQLHQVAMNLLTNGYHAVENTGGALSVQLKETPLTEADVTGTQLDPGRYAHLSFSDTGHGIDPAIRGKIFEPYFTTKAQGKGTGLGLSTVYGIVREAGGDILLHSEIGHGTRFDIYLPVIGSMGQEKQIDACSDLPRGAETILLVDDEAAIVRMEQQMLERLGYRVESRTSSAEALKAFCRAPYAFDLVITDMAMPGMTGDQLASRILAVAPQTPIIICTGFSDRLGDGRIDELGIRGLLLKPVGRADMAETVRRVLDAK